MSQDQAVEGGGSIEEVAASVNAGGYSSISADAAVAASYHARYSRAEQMSEQEPESESAEEEELSAEDAAALASHTASGSEDGGGGGG